MTMKVSREEFLGIPTQEERREVAQRIRNYLKTYQSPTWRDLFLIVFGDSENYSKYRLYMILDHLADLIEPEPERTCKKRNHNTNCDYMKCFSCSQCNAGWFEDINDKPFSYCPHCGAKVVENAE